MTLDEKIKVKQVLFTFIVTVIAVPIWWFLIEVILYPENLLSDGSNHFTIGLLIFWLIPLLSVFTLILAMIFARRIYKHN